MPAFPYRLALTENGLPEPLPANLNLVRPFNFAGAKAAAVDGFTKDTGVPFTSQHGHGWQRDITTNQRQRGRAPLLADTYPFTCTHDTWECALHNGTYTITLSIGDTAYKQYGQNTKIEATLVFQNHTTLKGRFAEKTLEVEVSDGRLIVEIGLKGSETNTCLNWLRIAKPD